MDELFSCFDGLKDHRASNARRHDLLELLVIALCTFLCGGESCVDMADFAEEKEPFLREFLSLSGGLPSHDTPELVEGQPAVPAPRPRGVSRVLWDFHAALCRNGKRHHRC